MQLGVDLYDKQSKSLVISLSFSFRQFLKVDDQDWEKKSFADLTVVAYSVENTK